MASHQASPAHTHAAKSWLAAAACCASLGSGVAVAQPTPPPNPSDAEITAAQNAVATGNDDVARLATSLSAKEAEVAKLENEMGGLREAVNKAMVDLQSAREEATKARDEANAAREDLNKTQEDIEKAQATLDEVSRSAYRRGSGNSAVAGAAGTANTEDALARQTYLRQNAAKQRAAIEELDRLRTEAANKESVLREKQIIAEQREKEAETAEQNAKSALDTNTALLNERNGEHKKLVEERNLAKARLEAAKANQGTLDKQRKEYQDFVKAEEERKAAEKAAAEAAAAKAKAEEEARAKAQAEAEARAQAQAAEEARRAEAELKAKQAAEAAAAAQAEAEAKQREESETVSKEQAAIAAAAAAAASLAAAQASEAQEPATQTAPGGVFGEDDYLNLGGDTGASPAPSVSKPSTPAASGSRAEMIETVIARAESQLGLPYAWGGGDANGPTRGIRDGGVADSYGDYNKIGFDCSGLTLYAFAGVGIELPHYTGYQYQRGTQIPTSEMQRGDLIFYGPNAEYHVAIYLGDGMMIEAPQSGSVVSINPVRWSGMSPYAVRLI
ncbi:NlpC/P60 family protein [Corynebacterium sp. H130]|uniref:DIP1281 family NlpC/P60 protein n=1 Tax=Corynebacterium sp. H130 TaxID=3133444 RepID=UPI0030B0EF39